MPQYNKTFPSWVDFFINQRLQIQLQKARDKNLIDRSAVQIFEKCYPYLPDFFPQDPPALLHGDLWSGNYMIGPQGNPWIIDPAVYYGHRYMDLAMSKLFGGFDPDFYHAYQAEYPLEKNWHHSMDIANLYPLLVHVNLFGGGYWESVMRIVRQF